MISNNRFSFRIIPTNTVCVQYQFNGKIKIYAFHENLFLIFNDIFLKAIMQKRQAITLSQFSAAIKSVRKFRDTILKPGIDNTIKLIKIKA